MKRSFILAGSLFAISIAAGVLLPRALFAGVLEELPRLLEPLRALDPLTLLLIIFLNNSIKGLMAIVLGILAGIPPFFFMVYNGLTIGAIVTAMSPRASPAMIAAALAPHGVIEVPLLLLCAALGFVVGGESLKWFAGRESSVKVELRRGIRLYLRWILAGLLVAAAVEVFVTPYFVRLAGG